MLVSWLDTDDLAKLEKQFEKRLNKGGVKNILSSTIHLIEKGNKAVENGVRLATYKTLLDEGYTGAEAARIARDLTLDFNQRGRLAPIYDTFYLFSQANLLGIQRVRRLLTSKNGRKVFLALATAAFLDNLYNRTFYPEQFSKINPNERDRYWIMILPNGHRITVPAAYELNVTNAIGNVAADMIYDKLPFKKAFSRIVSAFADSFNPLGSSPNVVQLITPTFAKPIVQIAQNENWLGYPIRKEQNPFTPDKPNKDLGLKNVNPMLKGFTEFAYKYGIDMNPSVIEHLISSYSGGVGAFIKKVVTNGYNIIEGKKTPSKEIPFVSSFYRETPPERDLAKVYLIWRTSGKIKYSPKEQKQFFNMLNKLYKQGLIKHSNYLRLRTQFRKAQRALGGVVTPINDRLKEIDKYFIF